MAKIDERMTSVEGELNWHRKIGWGAIGVFGSLFLLLLTWYIPKELSGLRESVRAETTTQAQNIKADTATQLEPVKVELARLSALMDLARTKNPAKVFQQSLSHAADTPKVAAQTIGAVAQQAREDELRTPPSKLLEVNDQLQALVKADPYVQRVVWYARLELVAHRTFLNIGQTLGPKAPTPVYKFPGVVMDGPGWLLLEERGI
jgi:hypothetical protein